MDEDVEALLVALHRIAGPKGENNGEPLHPAPCDDCNERDCIAARALFAWARAQRVAAIGTGRL